MTGVWCHELNVVAFFVSVLLQMEGCVCGGTISMCGRCCYGLIRIMIKIMKIGSVVGFMILDN